MQHLSDTQVQIITSLLTPRVLSRNSRIHFQSRLQSLHIQSTDNLTIIITDIKSKSVVRIKIEDIDYMRLRNISINNSHKIELMIQSDERKILFYSKQDDEIVKELYGALTALIDI